MITIFFFQKADNRGKCINKNHLDDFGVCD